MKTTIHHIIFACFKTIFYYHGSQNFYLQLEEKARSNVKVVTCEWLLDCAKAQIVLDESDYLIFKQEKSNVELSQHTLSVAAMKELDYSNELGTKTTLKITEVDFILDFSFKILLESKSSISEREDFFISA